MILHTHFKKVETSSQGCHLQDYIKAKYTELVDILGDPEEMRPTSGKISTCWTFESTGGEIVTLYDWKMTDEYMADLMSIVKFRKLEFYNWHVAAKNYSAASQFMWWLNGKLDLLKIKPIFERNCK